MAVLDDVTDALDYVYFEKLLGIKLSTEEREALASRIATDVSLAGIDARTTWADDSWRKSYVLNTAVLLNINTLPIREKIDKLEIGRSVTSINEMRSSYQKRLNELLGVDEEPYRKFGFV